MDSYRPSRARVVILGGGFAGTYAAAYLAAADLPEDAVEVTLVSERNYFTFTPLLAEIVAGSLGREDVTFAHRVFAAQRGYRFVEGRVEGIDMERCRVYNTTGSLDYDYLVVALGARPRYFGNAELERNSLPFTSVHHAEVIRKRVIRLSEQASREPDPEVRQRMLTFAVAGAGPAGVEVAAEISHLLRTVIPRYYELNTEPRVVIYQGDDRILPGWNDGLVETGLGILRDRGIEAHLQSRVQGFDGRTVRATQRDAAHGDGSVEDVSVKADTLIWTAGTAPDSASWGGGAAGEHPLGLPVRPRSGHLLTDEYLRLEGFDNVFAAGDVAWRLDPRTETGYPPVAPIAINQGIRAAGNVENVIAGRPLEPYHAHHAGSILSLGAGDALVDLLGWTMRGRLAWAVYRTAYLMKLVGMKNKLRAVTTLALNHVFETDLTCECEDVAEAQRGRIQG